VTSYFEKRSAVRACGLIAFFLASWAVGVVADTQPETQILGEDLRVEQIAEDIWRHVSYDEVPGFGRSPANGLVVVAGGEAALIDTPWTNDQTSALIGWVSRRLGAKVSKVVVTHSHKDGLGGLVSAHRLGAESFALDETAELARAAEREAPRRTFSGSLMVPLGPQSLELRHPGGGHTPDNIVVWIPSARILYGGCMVRSLGGSLGYTREAVVEWPRTIQDLLERYPDVKLVVPGHGRPGGKELLEHTLQLLSSWP
jgi:metallo-beta-lactamase class B